MRRGSILEMTVRDRSSRPKAAAMSSLTRNGLTLNEAHRMPARACSVNIRWATVSPYLPCCVREVDLSQLAKHRHVTH
jgi:hypothetical protein